MTATLLMTKLWDFLAFVAVCAAFAFFVFAWINRGKP